MASDYAAIKKENVGRYGTDIGRIGPMLLADRYDDRTHFIFELLQNAEDALRRRDGQEGPRSVAFSLSEHALRVSHHGKLFTESDVRGICGIGEGTKSEDLTAIGRFGIGFKAVYAFTDSPEIHSGDEHFAIDSFVWPRAIATTDAKPGETIFVFPFRGDDESAQADIASGLQKLSVRTLLFLKEIEEISWSVENGRSGCYLRSKPDWLAESTRKVVLIGQESRTDEVSEETWLLFSREVKTSDGTSAGCVELAFALDQDEASQSSSVRRVPDSTLVVFFPTIVPTNIGFLIQGPYRTTPSRDNVPRHDVWNRHLVQETANLLVEALRTLRHMGLLSVDALCVVPIDRAKFGEGAMFAPLFDAVRAALESESLLPTSHGGHVSSKYAKLARTKELRELLDPPQLASLFGSSQPLAWLSGEITQDRTHELRMYLMKELQISEVEPATVLPRISKRFLEAQSDEWIVRFYGFLLGQAAFWRTGDLHDKPLIRMEDGRHVALSAGGQPQAFLPGRITTGFPTVRRAICEHAVAREFLKRIGLTEPDPVDDVVVNVLPKYREQNVEMPDAEYQADIERLLGAFSTDSKSQREKLLTALRRSNVVAAADAGNGSRCFAPPTAVYLATQRLKDLFRGVPNVLIVDDMRDCLRGEDVRDPLEACGAARYLQPIPVGAKFSYSELAAMRRGAGAENNTGGDHIEDFALRGLEQLLDTLPALGPDQAAQRAARLWEALGDVEDRRGTGAFSGTYKWYYYHQRFCSFDAAFVRLLNERVWVPDANKALQAPQFVVFENVRPPWKQNPFLLSKIRFKPPIIEALAREAGIEPGVLDLLKKLGVTSEAELRVRLGITHNPDQPQQPPQPGDLTPEEAVRKLLGDQPPPTPGVSDGGPETGSGSGNGGSGSGPRGRAAASGTGASHQSGTSSSGGSREGMATPGDAGRSRDSRDGAGGRTFISYLGVHPDEEEPDPDGLDHQERVALEEQAINLILRYEPQLLRTPVNNPGFDLVENDGEGQPVRWVEVKAMKGTLQSRPVGLSRTQFESAREHGDAYWLYVVEQAGSLEETRIARIQDPAGKARSFTFDRGWINVAEVTRTASGQQEHREG